MAMDAHAILAAVEMAIYILLLLPTVINAAALVRQRQTGWIFILIFVLVKITGAAILLDIKRKDEPSSIGIQVTVQILYNIAIGPLLAGTLSFVNASIPKDGDPDDPSAFHQRRRSRRKSQRVCQQSQSRRLRLAHLLIIVSLILGIIGGIDRAPTSSTGQIDPNNYDRGATYLKVSPFLFLAAILAISWGLFSIWGKRGALSKTTRAVVDSAAIALPLIFIRLIYSFLSSFELDTTTNEGHSTTFNVFSGSWVAYFVLVLLPQFSVVVIYNCAGILARRGRDFEAVATVEIKGTTP